MSEKVTRFAAESNLKVLLLCVLRRKYEWEGGGRGEGSRRERARDAVLLTGVATGGKGCEHGVPGSERDKLYLWLISPLLG